MRFLVLCLALSLPAVAQSQEEPKPTAWTEKVQPVDSVEKVSMPAVDVEALKAEDEEYAKGGEKALRFAATLKVSLSPETAGTWEHLAGNRLLWRLRIHSDGARSLNFGFSQFFMPPEGRLFIYSQIGRAHV